MNLHEYQARELFLAAGMPVPASEVVTSAQAAAAAAGRLGGAVVVKAQVHAGGRGKAGGVKLANDAAEAEQVAGAILGMSIKGYTVEKVLVAPAADIDREVYLGITLDRTRGCPVIMASAAGGVDIESVAAERPDAIVRHPIDPVGGLAAHEARRVCFEIDEDAGAALQMAAVLQKLYRVYTEHDASLVEVNPLIVDTQGKVWAIDAKMVLDDSALYRHPTLEAWREDPDPAEGEARDMGLSYIKLDGSIGCVVNGAGLAMATMDVIKEFGGEPANFLDIGGSSNPAKVTTALNILQRDQGVRAIFFNIFGGITRTDDVAQGIAEAFAAQPPQVPVVIRLTGTNEDAAREILAGAGLESTTSMVEGVKQVIQAAGGSA